MSGFRHLSPALLCASIGLLCSCSQSNNLLFGRVEAMVGTHRVVVTDCYRTHVQAPQKIAGEPVYRFTPCRDADVLISGDTLTVNGRSYGPIASRDGVLVDHSVVSIVRGDAN